MCLGLRVEAAVEVGLVRLEESRPVPGVALVVLVDASRGKDSDVNAGQVAGVGQVEGADDIVAHRLLPVGLAPVDVGAAGGPSSVENVGGLDALELGNDSLAVLHADGGGVHFLALLLEDGLEVAGHPALTAPDKEAVGGGATVGTVGGHGEILFIYLCIERERGRQIGVLEGWKD